LKILTKIFFSRTSRPTSVKLGANHLWVKGIQNDCSDEGPSFLQGGFITKKQNGVWSFKNLHLKNHWGRKAEIYMKAS
jgi:hypothetical protein